MWQRWNQTTHIFEKSTDNGANWTPLGLDASIITEGVLDPARVPSAPPAANVALKDAANVFTESQTISGAQKRLFINDTGQAVDARSFRIWNAGLALRFDAVNDAETILHAGALLLNRAGDAAVGRYIYEQGRGIPLGHWQAWSPTPFVASSGTWTIGAAYSRFTLVGKTVTLRWAFEACTTSAATLNLICSLPSGLGAMAWGIGTWMPCFNYFSGVSTVGFVRIDSSGGQLVFSRAADASFPAVGDLYIRGQMSYEIP